MRVRGWTFVVVALAVVVAAGGGARPASAQTRAAAAVAQPLMTFDEKMAWILALEDRRILKDTAPLVEPAQPPVAQPVQQGRGKRPAVTPPPPPAPDLLRLLGDVEPRIRRRAALAVGRVGLAAGVTPLATLLTRETDVEVRQMAAFAMGLIGSRTAVPHLRAALGDASPVVQGRAAEALGLIGDTESAPLIARMAAASAADPRLAALGAADTITAQPPELDAYRLAIYALTRLKAWDALLPLVTKADGAPVSAWWPVAYALGRTEDPRAVPALVALAKLPAGGYSRAFAARGLAALKRVEAAPVLAAMAESWRADPQAGVSAVRALGQLGVADAAPVLRKLAAAKDADPNLRLEAVTALGTLRDTGSFNLMLDLLADAWPAMRAAALRGVQAIDPDNFLTVLSGLDVDPHVSVRSALASILTKADPEAAVARLTLMLADKDARVIPAVVGALAELKAPDLGPTLLKLLGHTDVMVRAAAASALGALKVPGAEGALVKAYRDAAKDGPYNARAAALGALRQYGPAVAMPTLREALADKDWAVRVRAAALLRELDPAADVAAAMRPAPGKPGIEYTRAPLVNPQVSPHVFFETDKGTIEIELYVLDAPQACDSFLRLAREGFFTGVAIHRVVPNFVVQDGDPRGDGEGGPGYTLRDEINQQPYLRGTVGMALEWADTGGSQWFVTHSPQPHLDGRYTAFGRVVEGMDVVDKLQQWDVIRRVRTWDGVAMNTR